MLPSDILGVQVYDAGTGEFVFHRGPVFANVVLADELNRTNPRTQSALLEAMTEGRVTIENKTYDLPAPFFVIATQNPIELHGAYPLPESELDRFLVRIEMGYPSREIEKEVIRNGGFDTKVEERVEPVVDGAEVLAARRSIDDVKLAESLLDYVVALGALLRTHEQLESGASTRGLIGLVRLAKVRALTQGRDFCVPDDIKTFAKPALVHRLRKRGAGAQSPGARREVTAILDEVMARVDVPA